MNIETVAVLVTGSVAVISSVLAAGSTWLNARNIARMKEQELADAYRREQFQRLDKLMVCLREMRGKLQFYQDKESGYLRDREIAYGDAYAALLAIGDALTLEAAKKLIHPQTTFPYKLRALDDGLIRLAELLNLFSFKKLD